MRIGSIDSAFTRISFAPTDDVMRRKKLSMIPEETTSMLKSSPSEGAPSSDEASPG